mgnify:CR=1 FL=1
MRKQNWLSNMYLKNVGYKSAGYQVVMINDLHAVE